MLIKKIHSGNNKILHLCKPKKFASAIQNHKMTLAMFTATNKFHIYFKPQLSLH